MCRFHNNFATRVSDNRESIFSYFFCRIFFLIRRNLTRNYPESAMILYKIRRYILYPLYADNRYQEKKQLCILLIGSLPHRKQKPFNEILNEVSSMNWETACDEANPHTRIQCDMQ